MEETSEEWAKRMATKMRESGHPLWLAGRATCMACDHSVIMVCPYPVGLDPNAECSACHKSLVVFDQAEEMKISIAKKAPKC